MQIVPNVAQVSSNRPVPRGEDSPWNSNRVAEMELVPNGRIIKNNM